MDTKGHTSDSRKLHEFSDATTYADLYSQPTSEGAFFRARLDLVRRVFETRLAEENRGTSLLDVGCGPCHAAPAALEFGFSYTGIDLSESMVAYSRTRYGHSDRFSALVGDVKSLPFPAEHFDVVTCLGSLEYVDDLGAALREVGRVLKPGGLFVGSMLNRANPRIWQICKQETLYSRDKLTNALATSRLHVEAVKYFHFGVLPRPLDRQYPRWDAAIGSVLSKAYLPGTRWLASAYLVTARRLRAH